MTLHDAKGLVTGGCGFVGTNLIPRLVERGVRVRATIHEHKPPHPNRKVEYVQADLEGTSDCMRVCEGMDFVVLTAAVSSGAGIMASNPLAHLTPNVVMNARMLEAAYSAGVKKVLFVSSNTVYPLTDFPVRESDVTNEFYDAYHIVGWMKRFSEIMCEMYACRIKKPMQTIVLRPANLYGPYDKFDWKKSKVIPALIRRVVERHNPIEVWGDGLDIKDFLFIDDFVEAVVLALEKLDVSETLNIASEKPVTIRDVIDVLLRADGFADATVRFDQDKPKMIPKRLIDSGKAHELIGFEARTSLEDGLRLALDWYRREGRYSVED